MKKSIILLAATAALTLTGCYSLDRAPFDKPSSASFWQTEAQCKQGLMGVYAGMKQSGVFGISFGLDINSDIGVADGLYYILQLGTANARTGLLVDKWKHGYDMIQRTNIAMRNLAQAEIDPVKRNQMLGEARFLRALVYFHLLNHFGGLPIYDETTNLEAEYNTLLKPRDTEANVRAFILNDLNEALKTGLPQKWEASDYGRVTEGAVVALRGKLALYDGRYNDAITDFTNVINNYGYKLYPKFADLFNVSGGHTSSEMIFSVVNLGGIGTSYGMPMCFYAGTRDTFGSCWNSTLPSTQLADMYEYADGKPFSWEELYPGYDAKAKDGKDYYNDLRKDLWYITMDEKGTSVESWPAEKDAILAVYAKRDPRFSATLIAPFTDYLGWDSDAPNPKKHGFLQKWVKNKKGEMERSIIGGSVDNGFLRNNTGTAWENYFWRKFVPEGDWDGAITNREHTPVNFPLIRLADIHLLLAEAYNKSGDQDKAVKQINIVRARVGMPGINSGPAYLAASTDVEVFQRIFRERAFELANEGHRDTDLRRWRLSEKYLAQPKYSITGRIVVNSKFNKERDYLWPIPATEIEINSALVQNPGW